MLNINKIKVLAVIGTRPEAIKMAPLILALKNDSRFEVRTLSTGQHQEMIKPILDFFGIKPDFDFGLMRPGQDLSDIVSAVLNSMKVLLSQHHFNRILVQGDTSSAFAAGLSGFFHKIPVAHIEAGLRTGDMNSPWPEEVNRKLIAQFCDVHFSPTLNCTYALLEEGIQQNSIYTVGNTVIDALKLCVTSIEREAGVLDRLRHKFAALNPNKKLILVTVHRRESFGAPLENILNAIRKLAERDDIQILIPLHMNPVVRETVRKILGASSQWITDANSDSRIIFSEPLDYTQFIYAMKTAYLILTDSGGIQEEAPSLGKPVLVVRESTERPEALAAGTSILVGTKTENILNKANHLIDNSENYRKMTNPKNPYGDGTASFKILDVLAKLHIHELRTELESAVQA